MSASYGLDRAWKQLVVQEMTTLCGEDGLVCPLAQIKDVYSLAKDGASSFPAPVLARIHPEERDRLLMLVYGSMPDERQDICLVLESVESRDAFLEGLRMLCISATLRA